MTFSFIDVKVPGKTSQNNEDGIIEHIFNKIIAEKYNLINLLQKANIF